MVSQAMTFSDGAFPNIRARLASCAGSIAMRFSVATITRSRGGASLVNEKE